MSLNLFKSLSDLSGALASARNHRSRLSPGQKRRPPRRRIVLETLEDRTLLSVSVATDQTDYAPGSTALISGGGYQPGDAITLQVVHTDGNPNVSPANDPWTVTADDSGNIASSWYVDPASSAGDSLELQANDPSTGDSAVVDFTDSTATIVSIDSPTSSAPVTIGTATSTTIPVGFHYTTSGSGNATITASLVSSGGTTWATASGSFARVNTTSTAATINLTAPAGLVPGNYNVKVGGLTQTAAVIVVTSSSVTSANAGSPSGPNSAPEGSSFQLYLAGTNFTSSSSIVCSGTTLSTTFVNSTSINATVPASLVPNESAPNGITVSATTGGSTTFTITEADSFTLTPQAISTAVNTGFSGTVATLADTFDNQNPSEFTTTITWGDGSSSSGSVTRTGVGAYNVTGSHTYASPYLSTSVKTATTIPGSGTYTIPIANNGTTNFATAGSLVIFTSNGYQTVTYTGKTTGTSASFTGVSGGSGTLAVGAPVAQVFRVGLTVTDPSPGTATATTTSSVVVADGITYGPSAGNFSTTEGAVYTGSSPFFPGSVATSVFPSVGNYRMLITAGTSSAWYTLYTSGPNNYMYPNSTTGSIVFGDEGSVPYTETVYRNDGTIACSASGTVTVVDAGLSYFSAINTYPALAGVSTGTIQVGKFLDALSGDNHGDFTVTIHWGDGGTDVVPAVYAGPNGSQATYTVSGSHTYTGASVYNVTYDVVDDGGSTLTGIHTATVIITPTVSSVTTSTLTGSYDAGSVISMTLNFNGLVFITGTPRIQLNTTPTEYATYQGGSGTSALTFTYTVQPGDNVPRLDYASTSALTLNGGTIKDVGGNNFLPALPTPAGSSDLLYSTNIVIDTTAPSVTHVYVYWGSQSYDIMGVSRTLPWFNISSISVQFSENVNASSSNSSLSATGGSSSGFSYSSSTFTESWSTLGLTSTGIDTLSLSLAASIHDAAGNTLSGGSFTRSYSLLPGDFNGDGVVNSVDTTGIRNAIGTLNIWADMNGDGSVTTDDFNLARTRIGTRKLS